VGQPNDRFNQKDDPMAGVPKPKSLAVAHDTNSHFEHWAYDQLQLDALNPRLAEFALGPNPSQRELLTVLWQALAVDEIALSIATSGFYRHEPLFVTEEGGKLVVIEGNRRLAAVKILLDDKLRERLGIADLPRLSTERAQELKTLPIKRTTRQDLWQVVGFKHINGPAKWSSYAKAEYIAHTHEEYGITLQTIADKIGDRHQTVRRLYRTISVLREAERLEVYERDNAYTPRLPFTHLLTGLNYSGFRHFLSITDTSLDTANPVPSSHKAQLGEVLTWLFGDRRDKVKPIIASQNPDLRRLDAVLQSPAAIAALRKTNSLDQAHDASKGDERLFEESMHAAKSSLTQASGHLANGYSQEKAELFGVAEDILAISEDLVTRMSRKRQKWRHEDAESTRRTKSRREAE
jgi:hypothetical protein